MPKYVFSTRNEFALKGTGIALQTLVVQEASGDRTVTTFSGVNTARKYNKAEEKKYFGI